MLTMTDKQAWAIMGALVMWFPISALAIMLIPSSVQDAGTWARALWVLAPCFVYSALWVCFVYRNWR